MLFVDEQDLKKLLGREAFKLNTTRYSINIAEHGQHVERDSGHLHNVQYSLQDGFVGGGFPYVEVGFHARACHVAVIIV